MVYIDYQEKFVEVSIRLLKEGRLQGQAREETAFNVAAAYAQKTHNIPNNEMMKILEIGLRGGYSAYR